MTHPVGTIRASGPGPARRVAALAVSAALTLGVAGACGGDDADTATTSPGDTAATAPSEPAVTTTTPAELEAYIGLTVDEAGALADEEGRPWRIVEEDGEPLPATMDLVENRVNLVVQDGIVVGASLG